MTAFGKVLAKRNPRPGPSVAKAVIRVIIENVIVLFLCEEFSLREAARSVGVTANATYRHFTSRASVLTAVAAYGFEQLSAWMPAALVVVSSSASAEVTAPSKLRAVTQADGTLAVERPELFRLMFGAHRLGRIKDLQLRTSVASAGEVLGAVLDQVVAEGSMPPSARSGALLRVWAPVHGFAMLALDRLDGFEPDKDHDRALDGLLEFAVTGLGDLVRRAGVQPEF